MGYGGEYKISSNSIMREVQDRFYGFESTHTLQYNAAVGVLSSQGNTEELHAFLTRMKPHHINSFLGGTLTVARLDTPLIVYRTGDIGKFWTTTPPSSPWQQCLDMAMPPSLYPESMKLEPNFHPANKGILMYQIPAGQIIATGQCAPIGGMPGMCTQVYISHVDEALVHQTTWQRWLANQRTPLAFTANWNEYQVGNYNIGIQNVRAQQVVNQVMPRIGANSSSSVQLVLQIAETMSSQGSLKLYAFDIANFPENAAAVTYYAPEGIKKIILQTQEEIGFYRQFVHGAAHATLSLASPYAVSNSLYATYAPKIRKAVCSDYWDYKRTGGHFYIHRRAADSIFSMPQAYPISERLAERIVCTVHSMAENEIAVQCVAPRTFSVVKEYIAEEAKIAAIKSPPSIVPRNPVKVWDVNYSSRFIEHSRSNLPTAVTLSETPTMPWRPGISLPRRAPWYQVLNYQALGQAALNLGRSAFTFLMPPVMAGLDASNRMDLDRLQFPTYNEAAHLGAVITDMAVDYTLFARVAANIGTKAAMPAYTLANVAGDIANGIRDIPPETMMNNRDFLIANIINYGLSPRIAKMLLDDFDNGGMMSRRFNLSAAQATKTSFKPFEWYYDMKKSAGNLIRECLGGVSASKTDNNKPIPSTSVQDEEIIEIAKGVDQCSNEVAAYQELFNPILNPAHLSSPLTTSDSLKLMVTSSGHVNLLNSNGHQMMINIGMGSTVMTQDFHQFLTHINLASGNTDSSTVQIEAAPNVPEVTSLENSGYGSTGSSFENKKDKKPDVPFISNIGIGKVNDRLGLIATVAGTATVGVTVEKSGFLVLVTAEFGPEFWSALGAGLGVGAAVGAVLLAAKFFVNKHQKHIAHKINTGVKHTNKEGARINNELQTLFNTLQNPSVELDNNALLAQSKALMAYVHTRMEKEQERAEYAKNHHSTESKKAHRRVEKAYQGILYDLSALNHSVRQEQVQLDFIKKHAQASCSELIDLAQGLIVRFKSSAEAAAVSEQESKQPDPVLRVDDYFKRGYKFYIHQQGNTKGHHLTVAEAKLHLENGGIIEAKKKHESKAWLTKLATTYTDTELANIGSVRVLIVNKLLQLVENGHLTDARDLLNNAQLLLQYGTQAADLKLTGLSTLLDQLVKHANNAPSYWISELQTINTNGKIMADEEKSLLKSMASHQLINGVINNAMLGNFETSKVILRSLQAELPEQNETTVKLLTKLDQLQLHFGDVEQCMAILSANKQDKSRISQLDNVVEDAVLTFVIKKDIFANVAEKNFDKAEARCKAFINTSPEDAEAAKSYAAGIGKLRSLQEKPNQELLAAIDNNRSKADNEMTTDEHEIISATLMSWFFSNVFKSVLHGNKKAAVHDLMQLKQRDPDQADLSERLLQSIAANERITGKEENVLLSEYTCLQDKQKALPVIDHGDLNEETIDPHAETVINMEKTLRLNALFSIAFDKSKRGFNREAADSIANLRRKDGELNIAEIEEDFRFAHAEQVIGLFTKPLQSSALHFVRGFKPSRTRDIALGTLGLVNTIQIVAPTSLSLALQLAHAKCWTQNICPALRNSDLLWQQLQKDLNPFSKEFKLFNTQNYCNGALIYTQLLLKGIELLPLDRMVSEKKLHQAEIVRSSITRYGHTGVRFASTTTTLLQIRNAMQLTGGLFDLASAPTLLVTVTNAAFEAAYWIHYQHKLSRGEAPENPSYYLAQQGVSSVFDTLGTAAVMGLITGGFGWMAAAVSAVSASTGIYNVTCEATRKDTTSKALLAACNNISHYRNLQSIFQYIDTVKVRLTQGSPTPTDEENVKNRSEIILGKKGHAYVIYAAGEKSDSWVKKKIKGDHAFLDKLNWPDSSQSGMVEDEAELKQIKNIAKDIMISEPVMREYTAIVPYLLIKGKPDQETSALIKDGKRIVFAEEGDTWTLYLKNEANELDEIILSEKPSCFDLLQNKAIHEIQSTHEHYRALCEFTTACVVNQRLNASRANIENHLNLVFGGLAYVSDNSDQEAANFARITHLYQRVKDAYDQKNYNEVITATEKFAPDGRILINAVYQLPPHLAWQMILFYRFTTFIESAARLIQFRNQYEEYSKYISDSANDSKPWYYSHWESVKKSMEQIVSYAMQQFIMAAYHTETNEEKLLFLSFVTQSYHLCSDWNVILNDELKFLAASILYHANELEKCDLFMIRIHDLRTLIHNKNDSHVTADILAILDTRNNAKYRDILLRAAQGELPVADEQLLEHTLSLIDKKQFHAVQSMLRTSREFQGKYVAQANLLFASSNRTALQDALKQLRQEKTKSLHYWVMLDRLLHRSLESVNYSPVSSTNQLQAKAKLWGWRKICLDYIQKFNLTFEFKAKTDLVLNIALNQIYQYVKFICQHEPEDEIRKQVMISIELGHQAIRGENEINIFDDIEMIMNDMSYSYEESNKKHRYLPLDIPADGDCAFHVFNISRKEGIQLLMNQVNNKVWSTSNKPDVFSILLDALEIKNNEHYDRGTESFTANKAKIMDYLTQLSSSSGKWLSHNQFAYSMLDALALTLKKNLRVFVSDASGTLKCTSLSTVHNRYFATIDVLYTSANGFSHEYSTLNHFIRLQQLSTTIVELTSEQNVAPRANSNQLLARPSNQGFFRPQPANSNRKVLDINEITPTF